MEHDITAYTQPDWTKVYELKYDGFIFEEIVPNGNLMEWQTQDELGKKRIRAKIAFYRETKNGIFHKNKPYFLRIDDSVK